MIGGRGGGMIPKSTSSITINIFSTIVKIRVADLLRPNYTYFTINPTTSSFIFRYVQKYIMVTWVMGGRVSGLVPISISTITLKSFSCVARGKLLVSLDLYTRLPSSTLISLLEFPSSRLLFLFP